MEPPSSIPWRMHLTIIQTSVFLGSVGVGGAFVSHGDVPFIAGGWGFMLGSLARQGGMSMDKATTAKVVGGILLAIGGFASGVNLANNYLAYTGVGTIPAVVANAGMNAGITYIVGKAAARSFLTKDVGQTVEEIVKNIIRLMPVDLGNVFKTGGDDI